MTDTKNWQCPYCGHFQINSDGNFRVSTTISLTGENNFVGISNYGDIGLRATSIACLNPQCKELTLKVGLANVGRNKANQALRLIGILKEWKLLPDSMAKPQPECIPAPIKQDYEEACKIVHLSPKSAATLARRCLQGMIRDFCKISKNTLYSEIKELKSKFEKHESPHGVTLESIEAIDNVRKIGNIGAHMKIESNVVVDIDPEEGILLIALIEMLFKEWYIAQYDRQERLKNIQQTAAKKDKQLKKNSNKDKESISPSDTEQE